MAKKLSLKGLYKRAESAHWWLRTVRGPVSGKVVRRSTETEDAERACFIRDKVKELTRTRALWHVVEKIVADEINVAEVYDLAVEGKLHLFIAAAPYATSSRDHFVLPAGDYATVQAVAPTAPSPALGSLVDDWAKHLLSVALEEKTRDEYVRQVRTITNGLTAAEFTEDTIKTRLLAVTYKGEKVSSSTRRRYYAACELFYRWARKRATFPANPFEDARDWKPKNNSPRSVAWEYDRAQRVLAHMSGLERVAMTLIFGSGIEEGALLDQTGADVIWRSKECTMLAPGSKNEHREERTIFVDAWAWKVLVKHARSVMPRAKLWPWKSAKPLREAFYRAQLAAGEIEAPPKSLNANGKPNGKLRWGAVKPHTIHDARHSWAINRLLGLDGEPRQSMKYCANNLGHADEQMLMKVYTKSNVAERLRLLELKEAKQRKRA